MPTSSAPSIAPALVLPLADQLTISFQLIPPGEFRMGARGFDDDEEPIHVVRITKPVYLATYPTTQQQFALWKPDHENHFANQPSHPAEQVNWDEANEFGRWLTEQHRSRIPAGYVGGLPSEAQWEYACRAKTETEYHTGDGEAALAMAGWYGGNANSTTQPVGTRRANDFGLHDMHGNVWEWCRDVWHAHIYKMRYNGICDPERQDKKNADRVIRGGGWVGSPWNCRAAFRNRGTPGNRSWSQGFRVCLFPGPTDSQAER